MELIYIIFELNGITKEIELLFQVSPRCGEEYTAKWCLSDDLDRFRRKL